MSDMTSEELNYLGTFATIDEVYAVYPSGGVIGNFVIVDGERLHWNEAAMRWLGSTDNYLWLDEEMWLDEENWIEHK